MVGKILSKRTYERFTELNVIEKDSLNLLTVTVENDKIQDLSEGDMVSINITATKICNKDFDHAYPKGTIGTED